MRADRLVSILMLLQRRRQVSARELAKTLGVSIRTIYRDMDALSTAGIPVYAERGAQGGCRLVDDYRTDLTGLTEDEARALFLVALPSPLDSLGLGRQLQAALRKLYAALPSYPQADGQTPARSRLHLDWAWWGQRQSPGGSLEELYQAVQESQRVKITYRLWSGVEITQVVEPLGLVAKAGAWYLVCQANSKRRAHRASELVQMELLRERFVYPPDFDLRAWWETLRAEREASFLGFDVVARVAPAVVSELSRQPGEGTPDWLSEPDEQGWVRLGLHYSSFDSARQRLLGLGSAVQVLEPEALRLSIIDYARQILGVYK